MGRRFAVHAGAYRQALILLALASTLASAAPKKIEARVEFDRGVAAYKKGDYETASDALGSSFALEPDAETLFAWAQTERKLGRCDKAIELYTKLLAFDMPAENKKAVTVQIDECKAIVAQQQPAVPAAEPTPAAPPPAEAPPPRDQTRAWWKDPVGGALVGAGAIGVGLGVVFLGQARGADQDKLNAVSYAEFETFADRAESRGRLGVIAAVSGVALVGVGIYWYASRPKSRERTATTWLVPAGTGLAFGGRF